MIDMNGRLLSIVSGTLLALASLPLVGAASPAVDDFQECGTSGDLLEFNCTFCYPQTCICIVWVQTFGCAIWDPTCSPCLAAAKFS